MRVVAIMCSAIAVGVVSGLLTPPVVQAAPVNLDQLRGALLSQGQVSRLSGRSLKPPPNYGAECGKFQPLSTGACGASYGTKPDVSLNLIAYPRAAQSADFVRESYQRALEQEDSFSTVTGDETAFLVVFETQIRPGSQATMYGRVGAFAVVAICMFTDVAEGRTCARKLHRAQVKKLSRRLGMETRTS